MLRMGTRRARPRNEGRLWFMADPGEGRGGIDEAEAPEGRPWGRRISTRTSETGH